MATTNTPRQQSMPGLEPEHPEVTAAIEHWLDMKESAERAAERLKLSDDAVLKSMLESGVPYAPYTDRKSGKRKWRVVDTTPRARSVSQPGEIPDAADADEADFSESTPATEAAADAADTEVTHRRVPRQEVEAELAAIADETRARDNADNQMAQADAAVDGALRPARTYDDDDTGEIPDAADADEDRPTSRPTRSRRRASR